MPFDIGFLELCLVAVIALLVLGPERLPVAAKTVGGWIAKAKRTFSSVKDEINRELQIEELRKQIKEQQEKVDELVSSGKETLDSYARKTQDQIEETHDEFNQAMEQQTIHQPLTEGDERHDEEDEEDEDEAVHLVEFEPLPNPADTEPVVATNEHPVKPNKPVQNKP